MFVALLALASSAHAADDWKAVVGRDRVQTSDGKLRIEEYRLCKVKTPNPKKSSLQMKTYAEVPVTAGISRDYFLSFETTMQTAITMIMGESLAKGTSVEPHEALDCDPIAAPIGKVDLELNLYLTADGFQMAMVDENGKTSRESRTWESLFE